jgi:hypothetical protein
VKGTDIADRAGAEGQWTGHIAGTLTGDALGSNTSVDMLANIGLHYRGGHPLTHLPPAPASYTASPRAWTSTFVTNATAAMEAFLGDVNALDLPATFPVVWVVLRGYKNGAVPEAVTKNQVFSVKARTALGTMRKRLSTR